MRYINPRFTYLLFILTYDQLNGLTKEYGRRRFGFDHVIYLGIYLATSIKCVKFDGVMCFRATSETVFFLVFLRMYITYSVRNSHMVGEKAH